MFPVDSCLSVASVHLGESFPKSRARSFWVLFNFHVYWNCFNMFVLFDSVSIFEWLVGYPNIGKISFDFGLGAMWVFVHIWNQILFCSDSSRVNICPTSMGAFSSPTSLLTFLKSTVKFLGLTLCWGDDGLQKPLPTSKPRNLWPGGPQVFLFQCCFSMIAGWGPVQMIVFFCVGWGFWNFQGTLCRCQCLSPK